MGLSLIKNGGRYDNNKKSKIIKKIHYKYKKNLLACVMEFLIFFMKVISNILILQKKKVDILVVSITDDNYVNKRSK